MTPSDIVIGILDALFFAAYGLCLSGVAVAIIGGMFAQGPEDLPAQKVETDRIHGSAE